MAAKPSKGKEEAFSIHGSKRSRRSSEEQNKNVSLPQQPLKHFGLCWVTEKEVSMANPMVKIDLPLEEITEAQRAKSMREEVEDQLAEIARRSEAVNFAAALVERNLQNPPRHHGRNTICNVLFEGEFEKEEVG
ncbi:hypothetical protein HAX54_033876 [Datura stramonium]|uniref:Uncharacterized protein n=1 Tax=Datura stramonium TaxID=4076 RepID=A0ABS8SDP8_DATST|nr:hypothetical protein [Datura stramonium]